MSSRADRVISCPSTRGYVGEISGLTALNSYEALPAARMLNAWRGRPIVLAQGSGELHLVLNRMIGTVHFVARL